ncbi:glycosyl transferase family 90-domain-containing protein [Crucibulum laeve]|uniref:Glycosyl transferase family 90-domain-containing protein n=1 Tax=Crucibulum laeve TaxID=68775 RepID=A0A5C3LIA8_9AGAR|nr:glycosyl transferase family 90-domain-containing protein [Crucibulum laeve]
MLVPRSRSSKRTLKWLIVVAALALFIFGVPKLNYGSRETTVKPQKTKPAKAISPARTRNSVAEAPIVEQQPQTRPASPLGKHMYRSDGLLEVNEDGYHPIYELMEKAGKAWNMKLKRSSRTLQEAVKEYRRRYLRDPPKGFDIWWKYVKEHNVQLPDEYDQIHNDLEPFWGLEPADLIQIQSELENKKDSYTLGKNSSGLVDVLTYSFEEGRYKQLIHGSERIIALLNEVHEDLPDFRATFSPHDGPNRHSDYEVKAACMEAAGSQSYVERAALPKIHHLGWVSACSPTSPARLKPIDLNKPPPPPTKKTFIYDHIPAMDPCLHPGHLHHHGQFLSHNMGPTPQEAMVPEFSQCSTTIHHNIRIPTPYGWIDDILPRSNDPEFDEKIDERLLWRGTNTGMFREPGKHWLHSQRDWLVGYTNELNGTLKVLPPVTDRKQRVSPYKEVRKARVNPAVMDTAFVGKPSSCKQPLCDQLWDLFPWKEFQTQKEAGAYKYVMDVDGNGWSGRFKRLITSNSLIFKSTIYPEWYADRIAPWVHYVPIQLDLSDLHDALFFFRGDPCGEGAHEDLGRKIAEAGREWSRTFWRREDLVAYFFRLLLEYARLMSLDREGVSYHGPSSG